MVASVVPLVNLLVVLAAPVVGGYILHRVQTGLNRIWHAAGDGYEADQAWQRPPGGSRTWQGSPASGGSHSGME